MKFGSMIKAELRGSSIEQILTLSLSRKCLRRRRRKHPSMSSMSVAVDSGTTIPLEEKIGHDY
jgi:hypothetical protein